MFLPDLSRLIFFAPVLADLGLERNPNAERGLVVWSVVVVLCSLLTLWLATRPGGVLSKKVSKHPPTTSQVARGSPFMRATLLNVAQLLTGLLTVYALVRIA